MIANYRPKRDFVALRWDGKNRQELEDFVGYENVEWVLSSNDFPKPKVKNCVGEIKLGSYLFKEDDGKYVAMDKSVFEQEFEIIN